MNQYINAIVYALKNAAVRKQYYEKTNDTRFLNEANDWLEVASIYLEACKS